MKSPFPGMDPYLEGRWLDLHPRLIVTTARQIQRQLGSDLVASIEERVLVEDATGAGRRMGPDIHVVETRPEPSMVPPAATATAVAEPIILTLRSEPVRQRLIEIVDASSGGRVITIIEFLSPANKLPGDGRRLYRRKQEDCLDARVNLVEIDLTPTGERSLLCQRWEGAAQHQSVYQISAWRAAEPTQVGLYDVSLQTPLPVIRIPLRASDADAILDLQAVLAECYADARYDRVIDYSKPLTPPLAASDAAWTQTVLNLI